MDSLDGALAQIVKDARPETKAEKAEADKLAKSSANKKQPVRLTRQEERNLVKEVVKEHTEKKTDQEELRARRRMDAAPKPKPVSKEEKARQELKEKVTHRRRIIKLLRLIEKHDLQLVEAVDMELPSHTLTLEQLQIRHMELSEVVSRIDVKEKVTSGMLYLAASVEARSEGENDMPVLTGLTEALSKNKDLDIAIEQWSIEHDDMFTVSPLIRALYCIGETASKIAFANSVRARGGVTVSEDIAASIKDL